MMADMLLSYPILTAMVLVATGFGCAEILRAARAESRTASRRR